MLWHDRPSGERDPQPLHAQDGAELGDDRDVLRGSTVTSRSSGRASQAQEVRGAQGAVLRNVSSSR